MKCLSPVFIRVNNQQQKVACGSCIECLDQKTKSWALRLYHHAQEYDVVKFVTLTYDEQNVPKNIFGINVADKEDLQLFYKRLRQELFRVYGQRIKISYFGVSEYGPKHGRPHFHILFFISKPNNVDFDLFNNTIDLLINKHWKKCIDECLNIQNINKTRKDLGAVTMYIAKYLSYGKIYPPCLISQISKIADSYFDGSLATINPLYFKYIHQELINGFYYYFNRYLNGRKTKSELREYREQYNKNHIYKVICPKPFLTCSKGLGLSFLQHINLREKLDLLLKFLNIETDNPFEVIRSVDVYNQIYTVRIAFENKNHDVKVYNIALDKYLRDKMVQAFKNVDNFGYDLDDLNKYIREIYTKMFNEVEQPPNIQNYSVYRHPKFLKYQFRSKF